MLPSQPLNGVHDRALAHPALYDLPVRQQREVPDVMACVGQPSDDLGEISGSISVIGAITVPPADLRARSSTSYTPWRHAGKSWKSLLSSGGSIRCRPSPSSSGSQIRLPGSPAVQLSRGLRFAAAERPVDP